MRSGRGEIIKKIGMAVTVSRRGSFSYFRIIEECVMKCVISVIRFLELEITNYIVDMKGGQLTQGNIIFLRNFLNAVKARKSGMWPDSTLNWHFQSLRAPRFKVDSCSHYFHFFLCASSSATQLSAFIWNVTENRKFVSVIDVDGRHAMALTYQPKSHHLKSHKSGWEWAKVFVS